MESNREKRGGEKKEERRRGTRRWWWWRKGENLRKGLDRSLRHRCEGTKVALAYLILLIDFV